MMDWYEEMAQWDHEASAAYVSCVCIYRLTSIVDAYLLFASCEGTGT